MVINDRTTDLLDLLSRVMPEHGRLQKIMTSNRDFREGERRQNILDLCALALKDCTTFYRPGENPVHNSCPASGCKTIMST